MSILATGYNTSSFGRVSWSVYSSNGYWVYFVVHTVILCHTQRFIYIHIKNILVKQKTAKNSHFVLFCQSIVALVDVMGTSITYARLLVSYLEHSNGSYK